MIDTCNMIENAIYVYIYGNVFLVDLKDFHQNKRSQCGKFLLDVTHFVKSFINLVFTDSHIFLFTFIWYMALICIPVYNLESYEYFRRVFVEVLCHSFMRFGKVIFFAMKLYKKIYLHGKFIVKFIIEFLYYCHTCSLG